MTIDPIVTEVHEWRRQILAEYQGDARRYLDALKARSAGKRLSDPKQLRAAKEPLQVKSGRE